MECGTSFHTLIFHPYVFFDEVSFQVSVPLLKSGCLFSYYWVLRVLCMFWIIVLFQMWLLQIYFFFLFYDLSSHFLEVIVLICFEIENMIIYFDALALTCLAFKNISRPHVIFMMLHHPPLILWTIVYRPSHDRITEVIQTAVAVSLPQDIFQN